MIKKNNIYLFVCLLITLLMSCHTRHNDVYNFTGKLNERIIDSEGGIITFYRNYENDENLLDTMVSMNFPEFAVDTTIVFNFYEFYLWGSDIELSNFLDVLVQSDFFYFMPFIGDYNSNDSIYYGPENHLSLDFNEEVTITYFNEDSAGMDVFYEITEETKLYRIKIPRDYTWDYNIYVNFNAQGYPDGFNMEELRMIITGRWNENDSYGAGTQSLVNWEEVPDFYYNPLNNSVTFKITNTEYMYVMADEY